MPMKLFYSPVHDFIHKSVVVAEEVGVWEQIEEVTVYPRNKGYSIAAINSLAKVPTLALDDGTVLFGSQTIAEYLNSISVNGVHVYPEPGPQRWNALARLALADIFFDITTRLTHERLLDEPGQHVIQWHWPKLMRSLDRMEEDAAMLDDFDIGCIGTLQALTYFDRQCAIPWPAPAVLNYDWRDDRPNLTTWFEQAITRPSVATHFKQPFNGDDSPEFCQAKVAEVLQAQGKELNPDAPLPESDFTVPKASTDRSSLH